MSGTIFGIGPMELLMIAIMVLLIFGPERVPSLMRDLGRSVRKMRQYYVAFSSELKREMEPFQEDIKGIQDAAKGLQEDLNAIRQAADIRGIINPTDLEPAKAEAAKAGATNVEAAQTIAPPNITAATAGEASAPVLPPAETGMPVTPTISDAAPVPVPAPIAQAPATIAAGAVAAGAVATAAPVMYHNGAGVELGDDNPWAQSTYEPRSDKLDDDNPWAS